MLPEIQNIDTKDNIISRFQGLNQKDTANDEMFKDMLNMTSDEYPYLAPRESYRKREYTSARYITLGTLSYDSDIYTVQASRNTQTRIIDSVRLFKNFKQILINDNPVTLNTSAKERQLKKYGAYIVIFPDNIMYNTEENSVTNMSYEYTFSSQDGRLYLSDKDGIPFICDNDSMFNIGGTEVVPGGFNGIISSRDHEDDTVRIVDLHIHNAIDSSYLDDNYCKFLGKRNQTYTDGDPLNLLQVNILMGQKEKARNEYVSATTYPLYFIEKSGNEFLIKKYLEQQSMWYPVDLYVSWRLTTTEYETIKDKVKIGDYIKLHPLKSNDSDYEESDFNNREATWNLIQKIQNGMKVENIITGSGAVIIVFSNNSLDFLKVLSENKGRYSFGSNLVNPGDDDQHFEREIILINNAMYLPDNSGGVNSLGYKVRLEKNVPDMDYITVSANRIWGCSSDNHEIYACKQGDATAWYNYGGLASDSYAVTIASEGKFTGAITYNDLPYFFKEDMAYSIMGNKPKNYQVQQYKCRGVEDGAYKTLTQKDGYVYYKSRTGVERFNGNNTTSLTDNLEILGRKGWCADICEHKLFMIMNYFKQDLTKVSECFVYDINKNMWHKEDITDGYFEVLNGNLYNIHANGKIYHSHPVDISKIAIDRIYGKSTETATWLNTPTYDVPKWYVESGEFNGNSVLNKYITKFMFELKLDQGSKLSISFMYDDSGEWEKVFRTTDHHVKKLVKVPIKVRRCERMRYKIEGQGQAKIYSVTTTFEGGSEIG